MTANTNLSSPDKLFDFRQPLCHTDPLPREEIGCGDGVRGNKGAREADFKDNPKIWQEVHVTVRNELHRLVSTVREVRRRK